MLGTQNDSAVAKRMKKLNFFRQSEREKAKQRRGYEGENSGGGGIERGESTEREKVKPTYSWPRSTVLCRVKRDEEEEEAERRETKR